LAKAGVPVAFSRGNQLLHHKWAYIDEDKLISGSANWTKAAFNRNQDCFLVLDRLNQDQKKFMNALWKRISLESQTEICYKGS
jgi:phosphatidylserine/phosphatidylglycerophosphate/cardiolipin synthase-like enzyme